MKTLNDQNIDIKVHFIKDIVSKNIISVSYVDTNENISDILTFSNI